MVDDQGIQVGDRVKAYANKTAVILAIYRDWAWLLYDYEVEGYTSAPLADLTRISPAVPQPKFRVGQRVRYGKGYGRILSLHTEAYVEVEDGPGTTHDPPEHAMWKVQNLEAVPVCQTCGGKVADG